VLLHLLNLWLIADRNLAGSHVVRDQAASDAAYAACSFEESDAVRPDQALQPVSDRAGAAEEGRGGEEAEGGEEGGARGVAERKSISQVTPIQENRTIIESLFVRLRRYLDDI